MKYDVKTITTQQCKLPFDIETNPKKNQECLPSYILENIRYTIFEIVSLICHDEFGINTNMDNMVILSSTTDIKTSKHYIFNNIHFTNWSKACDFFKNFDFTLLIINI